MKTITIEDIAKERLRWAKRLQEENEKLKEVECDLYTELSNLHGDNEKLEAKVKRLRMIVIKMFYASNELEAEDLLAESLVKMVGDEQE